MWPIAPSRTKRTTIEYRGCARCDGTGKVGVDRTEPCSVCGGTGRVFDRETIVIEETHPSAPHPLKDRTP
jgi:DnaJ-class molecular chaperone